MKKIYEFVCRNCGIIFHLEFDNIKEAEAYCRPKGWHVIDRCLLCDLVDQIREYVRAVLLAINCIYYGKYLFTIPEKSKIFKDNFRQRRKSLQAIYFELDEISFLSGYMLLGSYIEASCNAIANTYHKTQHENHTVGQTFQVKHYYPKIKKINKLEFERLLPHRKPNIFLESVLQKPRFYRAMSFVCHVNNVIKHQSGVVQYHKSGKILIDEFKLRKEYSLFDHHLCNIHKIKPTIEINNLSSLTGMFYVYMNDVIADLFNVTKTRIKKIDMDQIDADILKISLKEEIGKMLMDSLERDAIIMFVKE